MTSRVFVSHASEDKQARVRPLVMALAREGLPLWLDRPGIGDSHFDFEPAFLQQHDIEGLRAGEPFDRQILEAHWNAGAVLGCLSRALAADRHVLVQELVLATYACKLVTCIVDDLAFADIPSEMGLIDGRRLQAPRIDTTALREAVETLERRPGMTPADLPPHLHRPWQTVKSLVADIDRVLQQRGGVRITSTQLRALRETLESVPVGPFVHPYDIPWSVIHHFGARLSDPDEAKSHFATSMQLALASNVEAFDVRQVVVTRGEVPSPDKIPPETYWTDVLTVAGTKSRRTLSALLHAPTAPQERQLPARDASTLASFKKWLLFPHLPRVSD